MMITDRRIHRRPSSSLPLALALLAAFSSSPILAQTGATPPAGNNAPAAAAPDPRAAEAERRLVLSRRRAMQMQQNEQYNQAIMAAPESTAADELRHPGRRTRSKHRVIAPSGHPAPAQAEPEAGANP
jgi:hypothetical protein